MQVIGVETKNKQLCMLQSDCPSSKGFLDGLGNLRLFSYVLN